MSELRGKTESKMEGWEEKSTGGAKKVLGLLANGRPYQRASSHKPQPATLQKFFTKLKFVEMVKREISYQVSSKCLLSL